MIFSVTILGSNAAVPVIDKFPSAQILRFDNKYYLIDCGEGAQFQMLRYNIPKQKINQIFISHLHGDHVFGLIGLLTSYHLAGREASLEIFAPDGLEEIIKVQLRSTGKEMLNYPIVFHVVDTEIHQLIFEDSALSVYSIPLLHRVPTTGYLFKEKQRLPNISKELVIKYELNPQQIKELKANKSIHTASGYLLNPTEAIIKRYNKRAYAYCSDTAYNPAMLSILENIDLLYHESTFTTDDNDQALKAMHSTAKDAASIAKAAGVKQLLLGHFSARYKNHHALLKEAVETFPDTLIANEGDIFTI